MDVAASLIAVLQLSAVVLGYLSDVAHASKERAVCAQEVSNNHALLTDLRYHIEVNGNLKPWNQSLQGLAVENGPLQQYKTALEELQARMIDRGRLKSLGKVWIWPFEKEEIASIQTRMERLKYYVNIALQMDHFKLSKALERGLSAIERDILRIEADTSSIRMQQSSIQSQVNTTERKLFHNWISPTDYSTEHADIIARKQQGTGTWFFLTPEVTQWQSEPNRTLYCPGIPGAGKTMISAIAIDELLTSKAQNGVVGIAFVFCQYKTKENQTLISLLAAILRQLLQMSPKITRPEIIKSAVRSQKEPTLIKRTPTRNWEEDVGSHTQDTTKAVVDEKDSIALLHRTFTTNNKKPTLREIEKALSHVITLFSTVYIIVDALDECAADGGTRPRFMSHLRLLQSEADVRLMVTSRFCPDIEEAFSDASVLEIRASSEDVMRYVKGQFDHLPKCIRRDEMLQQQVQDKICEVADGMFLLAQLRVESLQDKRTKKVVINTLNRLLSDANPLDAAYKDAIQRIDSQPFEDRELAKRVLSWTTLAIRPLAVDELLCALAVEEKTKKLDPHHSYYIEELLSVCAGLVTVEEEGSVVRLVHYTTQDFLERYLMTWIPNAQQDLTTTCLTYLSFDAFRNGKCSDQGAMRERLQSNRFLEYAANHWGQHASTVQSKVQQLASTFLLHGGLFQNCMEAIFATQQSTSTLDSLDSLTWYTMSPIQYAAQQNLCETTQELLDRLRKRSVNSLDSSDLNVALKIAAVCGHINMARLLISYGASFDPRNLNELLCIVVREGYRDMSKMLLDEGACVEAIDKDAQIPTLSLAAGRGHQEVVQLLLDTDADIELAQQYQPGGTALLAAVLHNQIEVVQMLIRSGADVDAGTWFDDSPLHLAAQNGHGELATILLEAEAIVDITRGGNGSALCVAAMRGHAEVVKILLDAGADIAIRYQGNTSLMLATRHGHRDVVKLLVARGADVNGHSLEDLLKSTESLECVWATRRRRT